MDINFRLYNAIENRNLAETKALLDSGANPNLYPENEISFSFMELAVIKDFIPGLEALLAADGDVNFKDKYNYSSLLSAAVYNRVESGRWLLRHGADVHAVNYQNNNALSLSVAP